MARTKAQNLAASPLLMRVAHAIAHDAHQRVLTGDSFAALLELGELASRSILISGIIATDEYRTAVEQIAVRHLRRAEAQQAFTHALTRVPGLDDRNAIEIAHEALVDVGELTHYYAGLASAIALLELVRR